MSSSSAGAPDPSLENPDLAGRSSGSAMRNRHFIPASPLPSQFGYYRNFTEIAISEALIGTK